MQKARAVIFGLSVAVLLTTACTQLQLSEEDVNFSDQQFAAMETSQEEARALFDCAPYRVGGGEQKEPPSEGEPDHHPHTGVPGSHSGKNGR